MQKVIKYIWNIVLESTIPYALEAKPPQFLTQHLTHVKTVLGVFDMLRMYVAVNIICIPP